jgi:apolipoprotein N-acyltransferase
MNFILKYRLTFLSLLSGLLFAVSWPAAGIPMLIFVAFVPLLIVEDHIFSNKDKFGRYTVLLYAWLTFAVFNILTTWWIVFASLPGVLMAVILNSLFMALAFFMMHVSRRVLPGKQGVLSLLIFWMTFEYLHLDWELSWSWLNLGNVFATLPRWIQWYEYTGTLGGTAWIIIMNICFYAMYKAYRVPLQTISVMRKLDSDDGKNDERMETYIRNMEQFRLVKRRAFAGLAATVFLIVPTVISFVIWSRYTMPEDPVEVVVVQPGRDPYRKANNMAQVREWTDSIIMLAEKEIGPDTRFVVVPEAALPSPLWLNDPTIHYGYTALKSHNKDYDSLAWVAGVMMFQQYAEGEKPTATARKFDDQDVYYDFYNGALFLASDGSFDTYFKSKLVPGIERMPFARFLRPVGSLVEYFGGTAGSMGIQDSRSVFKGPDGTHVAPVICYESIYGNYLNDYIRNGAELIFIITNDGWWRNTPGHRQHNEYARLRAIETRRSIARAAKTGISGFIDPLGNVTMQTEWWEPAVIKQTIHKNSEITFYVRNGDFLGRLSFFLMILLVLYMATQRFLKKNRDL